MASISRLSTRNGGGYEDSGRPAPGEVERSRRLGTNERAKVFEVQAKAPRAAASPGTQPVAEVVLFPDGPQRDDLADDIAAALTDEPDAAAFFDGLARFHREAYHPSIDAAKRRPELSGTGSPKSSACSSPGSRNDPDDAER